MKFKTFTEFARASFIKRACWLREANEKDVATVMDKYSTFHESVMKTVGKAGKKALEKAKRVDFNEAKRRLLDLEFDPFFP
jgi:hypothetical protein